MVEYPPYVYAYGQLKELFKVIQEASVPTRFTQDYLSTVLGLKSSSYRPMIPFLKRLGFIDQANVPTKEYSLFRDTETSRLIMAEQVRKAYAELYKANAYAHKLKKEDIISKLSTVLGTSKDDKVLPVVAASFLELCKFADFEGQLPLETPAEATVSQAISEESKRVARGGVASRLGIEYTINLNLPATTDPKVFEAIFKALKENLLS
jgi:hypothetical protein